MDPKVAKKTQDTLGKIIKKPPLTDKLLGKPPFRFLHDIMTSVIKTTGFMQGLFSDTEMNSENVTDKDAKIAFLQKAIDIVCFVTGKELGAKPVKIVAGHEPERTNEFLQALADAINKNVDTDDYVKRLLKGGRGGGSSKKEKTEDRKEKDKLKSEEKRKGHDPEGKSGQEKDERKRSMDRGDQEADRKRVADREKDQPRDKKHDKDRQGDKKHDRDGEKDRDRHKDRERESKTRDKSRESRDERHRDKDRERPKKRDQSRDKENESPAKEKVNGETEEKHDPPARLQRPASAKGSRRRREDHQNGEDLDELNADDEDVSKPRESMLGEGDLPPQVVAARQLARPSSARPAPPRPKQEALESEPAMRLGTGHPTNVIADNDNDDDDDDDNFLVQETVPPPPDLDLPALKPTDEQDTKHGALVQKMLESKKEVERGSLGPARKTEIERPLVSDAQRRKQREAVQKEVDKLRSSIQSLTRSANPLGKVMDYVQEDMDSMQQELDKWKTENSQHALDLKREMNVTDRAIDPLRQQLVELDRAIGDQLDRIAAVKSNIIRNDQKIQKMLRGISSS